MSDLYPERVLTAACRAGAKVIYEQNVKAAGGEPSEVPPFEELPRQVQNALTEAAIPIVWAGINAIPDGRWAIWEQGFLAGNGSDVEEIANNPYPKPEFDISTLD